MNECKAREVFRATVMFRGPPGRKQMVTGVLWCLLFVVYLTEVCKCLEQRDGAWSPRLRHGPRARISRRVRRDVTGDNVSGKTGNAADFMQSRMAGVTSRSGGSRVNNQGTGESTADRNFRPSPFSQVTLAPDLTLATKVTQVTRQPIDGQQNQKRQTQDRRAGAFFKPFATFAPEGGNAEQVNTNQIFPGGESRGRGRGQAEWQGGFQGRGSAWNAGRGSGYGSPGLRGQYLGWKSDTVGRQSQGQFGGPQQRMYDPQKQGQFGGQQQGQFGGQQQGQFGGQQQGQFGGQQQGRFGGQQQGRFGAQQQGQFEGQQPGQYGGQQQGQFGAQQQGAFGGHYQRENRWQKSFNYGAQQQQQPFQAENRWQGGLQNQAGYGTKPPGQYGEKGEGFYVNIQQKHHAIQQQEQNFDGEHMGHFAAEPAYNPEQRRGTYRPYNRFKEYITYIPESKYRMRRLNGSEVAETTVGPYDTFNTTWFELTASPKFKNERDYVPSPDDEDLSKMSVNALKFRMNIANLQAQEGLNLDFNNRITKVPGFLEDESSLDDANLMFRDSRGFVDFPFLMKNVAQTGNKTLWSDDAAYRRALLEKLPETRSREIAKYLNLSGDPEHALPPEKAAFPSLTLRPGYRIKKGKSVIRRHQLWQWYLKGTIIRNLFDYFFEPIPGVKIPTTKKIQYFTFELPKETTEMRLLWRERQRSGMNPKRKLRTRWYWPIDWAAIDAFIAAKGNNAFTHKVTTDGIRAQHAFGRGGRMRWGFRGGEGRGGAYSGGARNFVTYKSILSMYGTRKRIVKKSTSSPRSTRLRKPFILEDTTEKEEEEEDEEEEEEKEKEEDKFEEESRAKNRRRGSKKMTKEEKDYNSCSAETYEDSQLPLMTSSQQFMRNIQIQDKKEKQEELKRKGEQSSKSSSSPSSSSSSSYKDTSGSSYSG